MFTFCRAGGTLKNVRAARSSYDFGEMSTAMMPAKHVDPPGDGELVVAAQTGDTRAFDELVARHGALVSSVAYALVGNVPDSEEVAHEAFVVAWRRLSKLRSPESFRAWICGITRNVYQHFRRERRSRLSRQTDALAIAGKIASADPSPLDRAIAVEQEGLVWQALQRVPEVYRVALVLYY